LGYYIRITLSLYEGIILISTYTNIITEIDEIVNFRKEYGSRIFFTERVGHYMKSDGGVGCWNSLEKCITKKVFKFYAADGKYKYHCAYGAEVECKHCGCSQVPLMHALRDRDFETCLMVYRDYWGLPYHDDFVFNSLLKLKTGKSRIADGSKG
jgi:hypothetical protein